MWKNLNWFIFVLYFPLIHREKANERAVGLEGREGEGELLCIKCVNYGFRNIQFYFHFSLFHLTPIRRVASTAEFFSCEFIEAIKHPSSRFHFVVASVRCLFFAPFPISISFPFCLEGINAWKAMQISDEKEEWKCRWSCLNSVSILCHYSVRKHMNKAVVQIRTIVHQAHAVFLPPRLPAIIHSHPYFSAYNKWSILHISCSFICLM